MTMLAARAVSHPSTLPCLLSLIFIRIYLFVWPNSIFHVPCFFLGPLTSMFFVSSTHYLCSIFFVPLRSKNNFLLLIPRFLFLFLLLFCFCDFSFDYLFYVNHNWKKFHSEKKSSTRHRIDFSATLIFSQFLGSLHYGAPHRRTGAFRGLEGLRIYLFRKLYFDETMVPSSQEISAF